MTLMVTSSLDSLLGDFLVTADGGMVDIHVVPRPDIVNPANVRSIVDAEGDVIPILKTSRIEVIIPVDARARARTLVVRSSLGDLGDFIVASDGGVIYVHGISSSDVVNTTDIAGSANAEVNVVAILQRASVEIVAAIYSGTTGGSGKSGGSESDDDEGLKTSEHVGNKRKN